MKGDDERCLTAGMDVYLSKPLILMSSSRSSSVISRSRAFLFLARRRARDAAEPRRAARGDLVTPVVLAQRQVRPATAGRSSLCLIYSRAQCNFGDRSLIVGQPIVVQRGRIRCLAGATVLRRAFVDVLIS